MTVRARTRCGRPVLIPTPLESDFEDVHWALCTATALWDRGEDTDALEWLRRAAGAAADRDADIRAVELFKAAADVAGVVEAPQHVPLRGAEMSTATTASDGTTQPRSTQKSPRRSEPRDLVPPVPPEPKVSERFSGRDYKPNEAEQETFIRPETMLQRDDAPENETTGEPVGNRVAAADHRPSPAEASTTEATSPPVAGLTAFRVAVVPVPEVREVRLIFIPPGTDPPPGVAIAWLVPPSPDDARRIDEIYNDMHAKL